MFCHLDTLQGDRNFSGGEAKKNILRISKITAPKIIIFSPNDSESQVSSLSIIRQVGQTPLFFELLRKNCIFTLYCVYQITIMAECMLQRCVGLKQCIRMFIFSDFSVYMIFEGTYDIHSSARILFVVTKYFTIRFKVAFRKLQYRYSKL